MTLDEAIKHAEEVAELQEKMAKELNESWVRKYDVSRCKECAEEHRQLAEWLKELKKLKEQQPCGDCINRQAIDELSKELVHTTRDKADFLCHFWEGLQKLPPVTPQQKIGKWIINKEYNGYETKITDCKCSICGEEALLTKSYSMDGQSIVLCPSNYCPNCNAKMEK